MFEELQERWDQKLKASGFEDAEDRRTGLLKTWVASVEIAPSAEDDGYWERSGGGTRRASQEYFRLAGQFLHDHRFRSSHERKVWRLHAEGVGMRAMAKEYGQHRTHFRRIVARLRAQMLRTKPPRWVGCSPLGRRSPSPFGHKKKL